VRARRLDKERVLTARRFAACAAVLALSSAWVLAQPRPGSVYERQIATAGPGPQRLAIDAALLSGGGPFRVFRRGDAWFAEGGLGDLRLFGADGRPVPYLLVQPPGGERAWVGGRVLAIAPTKTTSGFEVDLAVAHDVDMMRVEGLPVPYLKRLTLEGSGDRERWTLLAAEATLFDLPNEQLRQNALGFAPGSYRYLRVTWNDANSGRVPLPEAALARRATAAPAPPPMTVVTAIERRPSEPGRSRYRIKLPAAALPVVALDLDVGGGHVYRNVSVSEARFSGLEAAPVELGRATLARVTRDGVTASALRVPIAAPAEPEIDLTIEDGANAPLDVRGVAIVLAQLPWIYFEAPAGPVTARYGDRSLPPPAYDLEAARNSIDLAALKEAKWHDAGPATRSNPTDAPAPAAPQPGPALDPAAFKFVRSVDGVSAGLVALPLDAHVLANSRGPALRFADVRVLDGQNRQLPFLLERRDEPLSLALSIVPVKEPQAPQLKASGSRQRSVYAIALPQANLPPGKLVVETTARVFQRTARIGFERAPDRNRRDAWFDLRGGETWRHADEATPPGPLTLPLDGSTETDLRLVMDEGDNAPLPITAVKLLLPSYRLRFYAPPEALGGIRLVYGRSDLQPPQYDLALLAPRVMGATASEVGTAAVAATAPSPEAAFVSPRLFWIVLGGAVLVLLGLIARLVRSADSAGEGDRSAP
jgi:hypothetical protein